MVAWPVTCGTGAPSTLVMSTTPSAAAVPVTGTS